MSKKAIIIERCIDCMYCKRFLPSERSEIFIAGYMCDKKYRENIHNVQFIGKIVEEGIPDWCPLEDYHDEM